MGLGGPNLVKGATGQVVDSETLGGAKMHTTTSAVAHYMAKDDAECLAMLREQVARLPRHVPAIQTAERKVRAPSRTPAELYDVLPSDHRMSYDMHQVLACLLDAGQLDEFQKDHAKEMICGHAAIEGRTVAVIANQRGAIKGKDGAPARFGGIIYTESAEKVAYFIETADREGIPILFVQDVSGFMVGTEAESSGIIRAGARFVEAMATARVPKLVLTVNHASGAGYYAMAGQGFDPDFIFSLPTGRMGVMEGESAVQAVHGPDLEKAQQSGGPSPKLKDTVEKMRADYEHWLDARFAGARGYVDAIFTPEELRAQLAYALRVVANDPGPHVGPFVLPASLT
jgi:acetyl-CoA carboxylase carboxyltransferase component